MPSKKIQRTGELEKAIRRPIRPQVIRPHPLIATDRETIELANAQMEDLHAKAIANAQREKLQLLLRRYELVENDWYGLALSLASDYEPGFRVDRQIALLPTGFSGPVRVKNGQVVDKEDKAVGRPQEWSDQRYQDLVAAVELEKADHGLTKDIDALNRIVRRKAWAPANPRSRSSRGEFAAWVNMLQKRLSIARSDDRRIQKQTKGACESLHKISRIVNNSRN
jgi:hypothetical protein